MDTIDLWTKDHIKNNSYFEEIFYSLIDSGFELSEDVYKYYGRDLGYRIEHECNPKNGYKPCYRLEFRRIKDDYRGLSVNELDEITELVTVVKSCSKRLQADLGKTYVDFKLDNITVDVIHIDIEDASDVNEDLISFQSRVHRNATSIYNSSIRAEMLNIVKTNTGLIIDVSSLSRGQLITLNKHIDKINDNWYGWYNNNDRVKFIFKQHIERKSRKMILTFIKKEIMRRNQ
jgi:hypothetical protein